MWKVWLSLTVALWLILSGAAGVTTFGNFIIPGLLLAILGFWSRGLTIGVLGLWLVLSSFVPSMAGAWNLIATGAVVAVMAIWKRVAMGRHHEPSMYPR